MENKATNEKKQVLIKKVNKDAVFSVFYLAHSCSKAHAG